MRRLLFISAVLIIHAGTSYSQVTPFFGDSASVGYGMMPVRVVGMDTLYFDIDSNFVKSATGMFHRWLDSALATVSGGGTTEYISDVTNFQDAITGDTANREHILHYSVYNSSLFGYIQTFSNGTNDSTLLPFASGRTYMLLPEAEMFIEKISFYTDAGGDLQISLFAPGASSYNSVITSSDSLAITVHLKNEAGALYLTIWKHKYTDISNIFTAYVTTPGFMILKIALALTMKAIGVSTVVSYNGIIDRRLR